jgi:hypothetical protein
LELGSKETWALITVSLLIYMPDHKGWEGKKAILGGLGFFVI